MADETDQVEFDKLITLEKAAELLPGDIKPKTVREWVNQKRLRGYRIGASKVLVNIDDLPGLLTELHREVKK